MKTFKTCISCGREHDWTVDETKTDKQISFHEAVCSVCIEDLRNNKFSETWSMTMDSRFKEQLKN